jgi:FKBP-type peptidyl-prolyl cis-trans isomerase FklB
MSSKTMKSQFVFAVICASVSVVPVQAQDKPDLKDDRDKTSYGLGLRIGDNFHRSGLNSGDVDLDLFLRGIKEGLVGKSSTAEMEKEYRTVITTYLNEARTHQMTKNKQAAEAYLVENKKKPGVITLPSGLQYKVLAEGKGESPKTNDVVTVNYRGTLLDGTEFDSSYKQGKPATFAANNVIRGWTEAMPLMKPGSKLQLCIPPELAYGERGYGQQIAPNSVLIFEVELLSFKPPQPAAPPAVQAPQPVTSDIIKVPSKEGLEKGEKIEVIKAEDVEKLQQQQKEKEKKKP